MEQNAVRDEGTIITKKGMRLISKLLASEQTLNFTKVEIGSGHVEEDVDLESMTQLVSYERDGHIAKCFTLPDENIASVVCQVSSVGTKEGFVATEAGLYAEDPDEGDVLYAYLDMWDDPQYIYADSNAISKFFEITMSVVIAKVKNVTAVINPNSIITREEFNKLYTELSDELSKKIENLQKQIGNLSELLTNNKENLVDAINEIAEVIRPLTKDELATSADIEAIIAGTYVRDAEWATKYDIMTEADVNAIIAGTYVSEEEDNNDGEVMTAADVEAIINETYVREDEENVMENELSEIVKKAFKEE